MERPPGPVSGRAGHRIHAGPASPGENSAPAATSALGETR